MINKGRVRRYEEECEKMVEEGLPKWVYKEIFWALKVTTVVYMIVIVGLYLLSQVIKVVDMALVVEIVIPIYFLTSIVSVIVVIVGYLQGKVDGII